MLRYRRYIGETLDRVEKYFSSTEFDREYARYIVMVLLSHTKNLLNKNLIPREYGEEIIFLLKDLLKNNCKDLYKWIDEKKVLFEDLFEALESYLYDKSRGALYIPLGRSRNDHVATVLRLYVRDVMIDIIKKIIDLRNILIKKSFENKDVIIPYFTHQQIAQCGSASIYFLSYAHTFSNITKMIFNSIEILRENPLGSGASAGSMVELDLSLSSKDLCLDDRNLPPYYATGSRLFILYPMSILTLLAAELSRLSEDMILYNNVMSNALKISSEHVATSSIMPHKRNLVTIEILRAKMSEIISLSTSSLEIYRDVPYGYNLDLQEINRLFIETINIMRESLDIIIDFLNKTSFDKEETEKFLKDKPCWSSDLIEYIALKDKKPVREIYMYLSKKFSECQKIDLSCINEILNELGFSLEDVYKMIREKPFEKKIDQMIELAKEDLKKDLTRIENLETEIKKCYDNLLS